MTTARLRRLQWLLGLLPLLAIALFHLWEHSPIRDGRGGVLERLQTRFESVPAWFEGLLIVASLLAFAGLGSYLHLRAPRPDAEVARERRRNTRVAGLVAVGFLAWHLATVWLPARALGRGALEGMALAEAQLAGVVGALAYVLGWSAFVVLIGYAVAGEPDLGAPGSGARVRALWGLGVGLVLWLWGIDLLAAYVAGGSLF